MHVISRKKLKQAAARHEELGGPLDAWFRNQEGSVEKTVRRKKDPFDGS